jgi:hypothetical protein
MDVTCSAEMKRMLITAISSPKEVQVDLARATDIDITFIQLLWAGMRLAEKGEATVTIAGRVPEKIISIIGEAGFGSFLRLAAVGPANPAPPPGGSLDD